MEPTIKVGSSFSQNGTVVEIHNNGVLVAFSGTKSFITFSECELLFGV
jgi:methyl coenzyme M reductase subunit C